MRGRIVLGLALLGIGVAWILDLQGVTLFPGGIGAWWPSLLVLVGVARLVHHPRWWGGPAFLITLGVLLQAWRLHLVPDPWWAYAAPAALLLAGAWVLFGPRRRWRAGWRHGCCGWRGRTWADGPLPGEAPPETPKGAG